MVQTASRVTLPSICAGFGLRDRRYFTMKYTMVPVTPSSRITDETRMNQKVLSTIPA